MLTLLPKASIASSMITLTVFESLDARMFCALLFLLCAYLYIDEDQIYVWGKGSSGEFFPAFNLNHANHLVMLLKAASKIHLI